MRDIVLTILIPAALIYGMFSARGSTLVLLWIGFQRPFDFSWGVWNLAPVWQIAFAIALFSNALRGQLKPKFPAVFVLFVLLFLWITATCFSAFNPDRSWFFYNTYIIPLTFGLWLVISTINDIQMLKWCLWMSAGGIGINAVKTGLSLGLAGGAHISDQISGFVGDNNVFGLTLCLVVAVLMGLRVTLPPKKWVRMAFYGCLALIIVTIVFTKSRGALVSLGIILLTASLLGGKPVRHLVVLAACAALFYAVIPKEFFGRLQTLENVSADESAMGRFDNWKLAADAANRNPVLGIGIGNHVPYHSERGLPIVIRVAHSVYFQVLGELSYFGFTLYVLIVLITWMTMWRNWRRFARMARDDEQFVWLRNLTFWLFCGFNGYVFGSGLLNMLYIEFPWYVMLFSALIYPLAMRMKDPAVPATGKTA